MPRPRRPAPETAAGAWPANEYGAKKTAMRSRLWYRVPSHRVPAHNVAPPPRGYGWRVSGNDKMCLAPAGAPVESRSGGDRLVAQHLLHLLDDLALAARGFPLIEQPIPQRERCSDQRLLFGTQQELQSRLLRPGHREPGGWLDGEGSGSRAASEWPKALWRRPPAARMLRPFRLRNRERHARSKDGQQEE